jgi:hypothetical protein
LIYKQNCFQHNASRQTKNSHRTMSTLWQAVQTTGTLDAT